MNTPLGIHLILGGARSGKSAWAEHIASNSGLDVVYLATATAQDAEMAQRIAAHRRRRPVQWRTVEEPLDLAQRLQVEAAPGRLILVDCLTLWLTNLLLGPGLEPHMSALLNGLPRLAGPTLLVSNEVGWGIVPENALARQFRDEQGRLNQAIAAGANDVTLIAAGLPLTLKSRC
jgi:adenosylcobinamide kinase/adenosylcobinamide-phosphate guanylyltransferase